MFFLFIRQLNEMLKYLFLNNQQDFFFCPKVRTKCVLLFCVTWMLSMSGQPYPVASKVNVCNCWLLSGPARHLPALSNSIISVEGIRLELTCDYF